jgi:tetratricopeptide (TPR) repeat protein
MPLPIAPIVLSQLGDLFLRRNMPLKAIQVYHRLDDNYRYTSAGEQARRKLANAYLAYGSVDSACSIYAELLEQEKHDPLGDETEDSSLLLALAKGQQAAGNLVDAKSNLQRILAIEQKGAVSAEALNLLGRIYRSEGSVDLAASSFKQAESASPSASGSRDIADLLFNSDNYTEAMKQYQQLSITAASDSERQFFDARVIICHLRKDEVAVVEKLVADFKQRYKNAEIDIANIQVEKGNSFYRKEDYLNAKACFEAVVDKYDETPAAPQALYWIGKILETVQKPQEAIEQFNMLIKKYPNAPVVQRAHFALGNIFYNAEKWDESIQNYRKVTDDPKADASILPFAMSNLIETYEAAGINDAALALTRKYIEKYPGAEDALDKKIKIGILYTRLGYSEQAILQLQGLLDQAGSDLEGEIRYYVAEANYAKGDYQQAILDFLKVPYLVTKKGKIDWTANSYYMAGQSYEKMGRFDQALTMYQQIIDRPGIDETFKAAAKKEIDRVKLVLQK